jgi:hypothetical protein
MSNELRYYDALKHIATGYQTVEQLRRGSEKRYGLEFTEALGYAYENIIDEARRAIRGARRPKSSVQGAETSVQRKAKEPA